MSTYLTLRLTRRVAKIVFDGTGIRFGTGVFHIAKTNTFEPPCKIMPSADFKSPIHMGAFSATNGETQEGIVFGAKIGRYCSIAKHAKIGLLQHPPYWIGTSTRFYNPYECDWHKFVGKMVKSYDFQSQKFTEVGNDVWLGNDVALMTGVKIGDGQSLLQGRLSQRTFRRMQSSVAFLLESLSIASLKRLLKSSWICGGGDMTWQTLVKLTGEMSTRRFETSSKSSKIIQKSSLTPLHLSLQRN